MNGTTGEAFFDLAAFLITGARQLPDAPPVYGSLYMLKALRMVIELQERIPGIEVDAFLRSVREQLDKREYVPSSQLSRPESIEPFKSYLDKMIAEFAKEAKRRLAAKDHAS